LLGRQLRQQLAGLGELVLHLLLVLLQRLLGRGERGQFLGGALALGLGRLLLLLEVLDGLLLTAAHAVQHVRLREELLRVLRQQQGGGAGHAAVAVLGGRVVAEFAPRVVQLRGALGGLVECPVRLLALGVGLLFGLVVLLGRDLGLLVELV